MMLEDEIRITHWFRIHFVENPGMAFSMELPGRWGKMLLSAFRLLAVVAGVVYIKGLFNKKTHWKKIVSIKVALLIRGSENSAFDSANTAFNLFGEEYSKSRGLADKGTQFFDADFPNLHKNRLRKAYSTTILIRNSVL